MDNSKQNKPKPTSARRNATYKGVKETEQSATSAFAQKTPKRAGKSTGVRREATQAQDSIAYDPDNMPMTEKDFETGKLVIKRRRGRPEGSNKERITARLDKDVIVALKADGPGWQTRMNAMLRDAFNLDAESS